MQFVDYAKIHVRSGRGGNGCVSFRREKFVPRGGPDGGDGGDGGDVYVKGDPGRMTLLDLRYQQHYRAGDGAHGRGKDMHGRSGTALEISVPVGTVVRDAETGRVLAEVLDEAPQRILRGGRGGRGNTRFRSSTHRVPEEWEPGGEAEERWLELELKLMADVGLVGFPNAGKSTLISRISRAHPKVADYPFTTLVPSLGVVRTEGFESFVVADIPGIIEGAHEGHGLGLRFLRHIERTALLLLVVDAAQPAEDAVHQYEVLLEEMAAFSPALPARPRAVALTKLDAAAGSDELATLQEALTARGERVFGISAVSGEGLDALLRHLAAAVREVRAAEEAPRAGAG